MFDIHGVILFGMIGFFVGFILAAFWSSIMHRNAINDAYAQAIIDRIGNENRRREEHLCMQAPEPPPEIKRK